METRCLPSAIPRPKASLVNCECLRELSQHGLGSWRATTNGWRKGRAHVRSVLPPSVGRASTSFVRRETSSRTPSTGRTVHPDPGLEAGSPRAGHVRLGRWSSGW